LLPGTRPLLGSVEAGLLRPTGAVEESVKDRPGITVSEAMEDERMSGINRNYLYRLASELVESGELRKEGQGYHPVA
jgi:hypothetical protein